MVTIGIGNENLTVFIASHQLNYLLYTLRIKLVEDVIEQ